MLKDLRVASRNPATGFLFALPLFEILAVVVPLTATAIVRMSALIVGAQVGGGFALFTAFLLFCFYLKWQPYLARLELPLFVLAAPLAALLLDRLRPRPLALLACLFLLGVARNAILQNWTRPLKGPHNLFVTARDDNYFNDMVQFNNRASYLPAVTLAVRSGCRTVGIDITRNQLEYPFQALLLERAPLVRFVHTGVANASARYAPANPPRPCAVVCLDCAGHADKIALYRAFGPPVTVGTFLWFER